MTQIRWPRKPVVWSAALGPAGFLLLLPMTDVASAAVAGDLVASRGAVDLILCMLVLGLSGHDQHGGHYPRLVAAVALTGALGLLLVTGLGSAQAPLLVPTLLLAPAALLAPTKPPAGLAAVARGLALGAVLAAMAWLVHQWSDGSGNAGLPGIALVLLGAGYAVRAGLRTTSIAGRCAAAVSGLGWMGLLGWWLQALVLERGGIHLVPIALNAALVMVLMGHALWLQSAGRARLGWLVGLACVPMVLAPMLAGHDGFADALSRWLWAQGGIHVQAVAPGRPSPNAAVGLLVSVAALGAAVLASRRGGWWTAVWAGGLMVVALGLLSLVGAVFGGAAMRLFGTHVPVSPPMALGLIVLGIGLAASTPRSPWESRYRTYLFPALMGMGVVGLSLLLWSALEQQQARVARQTLQNERDSVVMALRTGMEAQIMMVRRMAARFAGMPERARAALFMVDAEQHLDDIAGLRALGYVNAQRVLQLTVARPATSVRPGALLDTVPSRRRVFDQVDATHQVRLSDPTSLLLGRSGELIVAPVLVDSTVRGYVVGVQQFDRLFPSLLAALGDIRNLRVSQGRQLLYERGLAASGEARLRTTIDLYGRRWQLDVYSNGDRLPGRMPQLALLLGFALGGLLTVALRLSALARERARLAEGISAQLRHQSHAREQAQKALVEVQGDMLAVLESMSDGVIMVDRRARFTYVNPQAAQLLGVKPADLFALDCWPILPRAIDESVEGGAVQTAWRRAMDDNKPVTLDVSHAARARFYEMRVYPHARGLTAYLHDVTARKRQEGELLQRDAEYRHSQQLARLGSWELHLRTGDLRWSEETCAIFGVSRSPGPRGIAALRQRVHPEDWPGVEEAHRRLRDGDSKVEVQYRVIRPDGEIRMIREIGERLVRQGDAMVAGAVQDITESQRVEAALREAGSELERALEATRLVMDSAPDVIIVLDNRGHFLQVSAASRRLWGYAPEELVGESMVGLIHPEDREASLAAVAEIVGGHALANFRNRNITRDGLVRHMQWSGAWSEQSQCLYVVGRDHSELHHAEQMEARQQQILTAIAQRRPLADVLGSVVTTFETRYPEARCTILLLEDEHLRHGAAPSVPATYCEAIDGAKIGPRAGSCGTAAWRAERVVVADIASDPLWSDYAALALAHGLRACWSTPVMARDGRVLGTFAVYYGQPREPSAAELGAVDGLATLAGMAIEHERAFQQVSESEQRVRSLFDYHPDAVIALGVEGDIQQANPAAARLLGAAGPELQGRSLARHVGPADRVAVDAVLSAAAHGEPGRLDVHAQACDGNGFPAQLVAIPIVVGGVPKGTFVVLQDHRELRRAQQGMASQLALLLAIADSVGEGLLAVDVTGQPTFLNRMASRLFGVSGSDLPTADQLPAAVREVLQLLLEGSASRSDDDAVLTLQSGDTINVAYLATPLRIDGVVAGAVVAFRDIADIKFTRRALADRQRFFELSEQVFCIFDPDDGRFMQVNPAFCRLLGYDEATALTFGLSDLVHPQDLMATEDAATWQRDSGEPLQDFVNRLRRRDGSYIWLEWVSRRVPEGLLFAVARDVTAKRQADAALARAMDDLRIRNRELQDFAYVASHDLQEPLRKIQAFSDRLQSRLGATLDDSSRDYLQRMGDAASRMQTLIDDLLAYSRVGTQVVAPAMVDLSAELATVLDDLDARIQEAGATIASDSLPTIQADATQMRQLLQNLLANALKFRASERPCRIAVRALPRQGQGAGAASWELSVEDSGIGFDQAYAQRIFAPFQRLHPRNVFAGTGIGLAIVRRIVERHGGAIHAEGVPGKGAVFVVTLPTWAPVSLLPVLDDTPLTTMDTPGAIS